MLPEEVSLYLDTEDGHKLAIYTRGNKNMPAVIFLHGGPGASISAGYFDFFDLSKWYVIAFDQRGCGNSKPFGSLKNNLVPNGVEDIEMIRKHFNIDKWVVFGGSYGSTLSLAYAIAYPERVEALVLRGIFLARKKDIDWSFQKGGASLFHPDSFEKFESFIPAEKRSDLIKAYYDIFSSDDKEYKRKACKVWADWETSLITLKPMKPTEEITDYDLSSSLLECHFMINNMGWKDDNYILENIKRIENIPTYIVQGRYDMDCVPEQAWLLKKNLKNIKSFKYTCCGHLSFEPQNEKELKRIMVELSKNR